MRVSLPRESCPGAPVDHPSEGQSPISIGQRRRREPTLRWRNAAQLGHHLDLGSDGDAHGSVLEESGLYS